MRARSGRAGNPPSIVRRRLLVALGFGAANVAGLSKLRRLDDGDLLGRERGPRTPPALDDAPAEPVDDHVFDLVIRRGRVIDPESGFDRVANVGVDGATITALSFDRLEGRIVVDAKDLVVAPGFIDILSYEPNPYGIWNKVADGVTSNLGCHGLNFDANDFFAQVASQGSPCHYGGCYDNPYRRGEGKLGLQPDDAATASELDRLADDVEEQLRAGWFGVDFEPEYTPGISFEEIRRQAEVAARLGVPCFFHGRYSDMQEPGTNRDTITEILEVARQTGAAVHVDHITSTGGTFSMAESLSSLQAAINDGFDVSACMYPYTFWATYLGSARFADGWQERFRITYEDLVIPGTGEHLTAETFEQHRAANTLAAALAIPEADVRAGLRSPLVMIGSDAILEPGNNNHPRASGCFSRVLGHYVRDKEVLSLQQALAKMTIMPARRVQRGAPAMRRKGRLQRGADADITVFDPERIADKATLTRPDRRSTGIRYVVVAGQIVQDRDGQNTDVLPGQPIKSQLG